MKLFPENVTEYFSRAETVSTRPLLEGGGGRWGGPWDEAILS